MVHGSARELRDAFEIAVRNRIATGIEEVVNACERRIEMVKARLQAVAEAIATCGLTSFADPHEENRKGKEELAALQDLKLDAQEWLAKRR